MDFACEHGMSSVLDTYVDTGLDPGGSEVKVSACNAGDPGSIPG